MPSANRNTGRSLQVLDALVNFYQLLALTNNTSKVYSQGAKTFLNFCLQYNIPCSHPIQEQLLLYFAAHCAYHMKLAASTINTYLFGIRDWCIGQGLPDPLKTIYGQPLLRLDRVLRGIKKLHKAKTRPRLPITVDILRMLIFFLSFSCFGKQDDLMLSAVLTLAFYGFLRCGEFTVPSGAAYSPRRHLSMQDVVFYPSFYNPTYMTVHFKYSKTDPFGKGHVITLHVTNTLTCPVMAMKQYLETRTFDLYGPLFLFADGSALTRCQFIRYLRFLLEKVGLQAELYAGHSFRIGAATTAAAAGLPDWLIQAMGRWSSECYKRYIRITNHSLHQACREMALVSHVW